MTFDRRRSTHFIRFDAFEAPQFDWQSNRLKWETIFHACWMCDTAHDAFNCICSHHLVAALRSMCITYASSRLNSIIKKHNLLPSMRSAHEWCSRHMTQPHEGYPWYAFYCINLPILVVRARCFTCLMVLQSHQLTAADAVACHCPPLLNAQTLNSVIISHFAVAFFHMCANFFFVSFLR